MRDTDFFLIQIIQNMYALGYVCKHRSLLRYNLRKGFKNFKRLNMNFKFGPHHYVCRYRGSSGSLIHDFALRSWQPFHHVAVQSCLSSNVCV